MANLSLNALTDNSLDVLMFLDIGMNAGSYYIYITNDSTGQTSGDLGYVEFPESPHRSMSYNFTGLSPGTEYWFSGRYGPTASGPWTYVPSRSFTTTGVSAPGAANAYLSAYNISHNFIEIGVLGLDAAAYNYNIYIGCDQTGEQSGDLGQGGSTNSYTHLFTGLEPNTNYTFYAHIWNSASQFWYKSRSDLYTSAPPRPSNFSWGVPVVQGQDFNMTAYEWNRFLQRVNEFRVYKNVNQASFNYAVQGNTAYASQYNEARNATAILSASVPPTRSSTNDVLASDLNQLVTALNSTI